MAQTMAETLTGGESRATAILVGNIIPTVFTSIFMLARVVSRGLILRKWRLDDSLLTFSWLLSLVMTILYCLQVQYGAGKHIMDIPSSDVEASLKLQYATLLMYNIVVYTTKVSICLFYLQIFRSRITKWVSYLTITFLSAYTIALELVSIFQCNPVSAVFDPVRPEGQCIELAGAFYGSAACNIVSDIVIIAVAITGIMPLQLPRVQKGLLFLVVTMGWLVIAASVVRVVRISTILSTTDRTWAAYDQSIWSTVEIQIGIFCAAAPSTWPILLRIFPPLIQSVSNFTNGSIEPLRSQNRQSARKSATSSSFIHTMAARSQSDASEVESQTGVMMYPSRIVRSTEITMTTHLKGTEPEVRPVEDTERDEFAVYDHPRY